MSIKKQIKDLKSSLKKISNRAENTAKKYHISKARLTVGCLCCMLFYGCTIIDYFLCEFFLLNRKGKKQFMTKRQRNKYEAAHSNEKFLYQLYNKESTFVRFADFMKRDWCGQTLRNTEEDFKRFAEAHDRCIVKPYNDCGGKGIRIVPTNDIDGKDLYTFCKENNYMVEELIEQCDELNAMYPKAINTARILTNNGKCVAAAFRMGSGGGEIDNATSGGMFAEIDAETGIVVSHGCNLEGNRFIIHPDTGTVIPGFRIPRWDECLKLVADAEKLIDGVSLIGWDVAVSKDGPTIVEINVKAGLRIVQVPNGHGIRDKILN